MEVAKQVGNHDKSVDEQVDQVVHVPIIHEVFRVRFTILTLYKLAFALIENKDQAITEQRVVKSLVVRGVLNVFLKCIDQESEHTDHIKDERQELSLIDLYEVDVPIATNQNTD